MKPIIAVLIVLSGMLYAEEPVEKTKEASLEEKIGRKELEALKAQLKEELRAELRAELLAKSEEKPDVKAEKPVEVKPSVAAEKPAEELKPVAVEMPVVPAVPTTQREFLDGYPVYGIDEEKPVDTWYIIRDKDGKLLGTTGAAKIEAPPKPPAEQKTEVKATKTIPVEFKIPEPTQAAEKPKVREYQDGYPVYDEWEPKPDRTWYIIRQKSYRTTTKVVTSFSSGGG